MHEKEIIDLLEKFLPILDFSSIKQKPTGSTQVSNFNSVIESVKIIDQIELLKPYTTKFLSNDIIAANETASIISISDPKFDEILRDLKDVKISGKLLLELLEKRTRLLNNSLLIKLPSLKTFEDLSKVANEFKLAIDIPDGVMKKR